MHIDFIWNLTGAAKRLREYARFGHDLFRKVLNYRWFFFSLNSNGMTILKIFYFYYIDSQ